MVDYLNADINMILPVLPSCLRISKLIEMVIFFVMLKSLYSNSILITAIRLDYNETNPVTCSRLSSVNIFS